MEKMVVSCEVDLLASVLRWLSDKYDVNATQLAAIVLPPGSDLIEPVLVQEIDQCLICTLEEIPSEISKDSVIVLAHRSPDEVLGRFLSAGFYNIFNFWPHADKKIPIDKFVAENASMYVGPHAVPTPPSLEYLRYREESLPPELIPRHRIFIVNSLPKSGTVWMIAMLEELLKVQSESRITMSHVNDLREDWGKFNNHGAVVLVRDLRDVVLSFYHHVARNDLQNGFKSPRYLDIEDFYFNYFLGLILKNNRYCNGDFLSWINFAASKAMPILRYEDLLSDTVNSLKKVMNFWKISIEDNRIDVIAKKFSFSEMALTERPGSSRIDNMISAGHLRMGISGEWTKKLPDAVREDIDVRFFDFQKRFFYV